MIARYGDLAYYHARAAGLKGPSSEQRRWSKVAVCIAARMGHEIGRRGADL